MKLEDYLKELASCPDTELENRMKIQDNFPILVSCKMETIITHFSRLGRFTFDQDSETRAYFNENERPYSLQVIKGIPEIATTEFGGLFTKEGKIHAKRQQQQYHYSLFIMKACLHPSASTHPPFQDNRCLSSLVQEVGTFMISEKIPGCIPYTGGAGGSADFSRIVYHQPDTQGTC